MTRVTGDWLTRTETQTVLAMLTQAGHQAYLVGGCVRNALLGVDISDIDMATDALPERVTELAERAGLRVIPTGLAHGTVTVVARGIPHEITTFRKDIATDGRHAAVRFSGKLEDDANRRDFTMNALYADANGAVFDPVCGLPDIRIRRVRFIGDSNERIAEDYLRILRFFRFHASYGDPSAGIDPEGLAACAAGAGGLDQLSGERIGGEMRKLLGTADPTPSVAAMSASGILAHVMPGANLTPLGPLIHLEAAKTPDWTRRAATLGGQDLALRWRLSKAETKRVETLRDAATNPEPPQITAYKHGAEIAQNVVLINAALMEQHVPDCSEAIQRGATARFPVSSADLMPELQGPTLGQKLTELEQLWLASDFTLSREDLLAM